MSVLGLITITHHTAAWVHISHRKHITEYSHPAKYFFLKETQNYRNVTKTLEAVNCVYLGKYFDIHLCTSVGIIVDADDDCLGLSTN